MRSRRPLALLTVLAALLLGALPGLAGTASAAPAGVDCPFGTAPGPPVDDSEVPQPGQAEPTPLPVPDPPVGGPGMGTCGDAVAPGAPAAPAVGVVSYVLADLDSGAVLAVRNPHARLRPASLMKTLTGLLVARRLPLDETITGTQEDADQEGTRVGIGPGGQYTIRQVFDSMMMASGNDAAHALAVRLTGSVPATVDLMNATAREIGALDTRAATPSGLDGPGMQTSAYDLASIFRVAMREEPFAQAVATRRIPFPGYADNPPFEVVNDNRLLTSGYPGYIGGKTGFTDDARHTFIGAAEQNGRRLVVVLMRGEQRPVPMYQQAQALLDHGFALTDPQGIGTLTDERSADPELATPPDGGEDDGEDTVAPESGAASSSWGTPLLLIAVVAGVGGLVALRAGRR
ncbi:D-alanyl-D-alanine carboxypeptidase family protein [Actinomycetospora straminea]|uniref:D-alanyl-D-alanine carboxypeptidase family protein n=1 Tax=Actinomycetospora straminea TaxID=663607 RepID=A0ABP9E0Y7_9PSEU|nr:D-alanyl-D-alanine carboxypeptidase family protein [Actinomycetospora straminea]MDD7931158.1 D-alanyl-D-alanine carboxypeptidase [Actinomycetospora straminea]